MGIYKKYKQSDGTYTDKTSKTTISAKAIHYSSIENTGEPIELYLPILRWEAIENNDRASSYEYPDGYVVSTETANGVPKTIFLWRYSKNKDIILFQHEENNMYLARVKK